MASLNLADAIKSGNPELIAQAWKNSVAKEKTRQQKKQQFVQKVICTIETARAEKIRHAQNLAQAKEDLRKSEDFQLRQMIRKFGVNRILAMMTKMEDESIESFGHGIGMDVA